MNDYITAEQKIKIVDLMGKRIADIVPCWILAEALGLSTLVEVARRIEVSPMTAKLMIERGEMPPPNVVIGLRRFYSFEVAEKVVRDHQDYRPKNWTGEQISEMRKMSAGGATQHEIADKFRTSQGTVSRLLVGRKNCRK